MLNEDQVAQKQYFKQYLLYIYFHKVNTFLGDAAFSKFLNAFDMKYNKKIIKVYMIALMKGFLSHVWG